MKATAFEYRFRFWIHAAIFVLGFFAPWLLIAGITDVSGFTTHTTWLVLASLLARTGLLNFDAATLAILAMGILFTGLGAWLRTWGAAYVGASIVQSATMHGGALLADGPYRRTRNPLYLGTLLHAIGISVVMPPSGAIFTIVADLDIPVTPRVGRRTLSRSPLRRTVHGLQIGSAAVSSVAQAVGSLRREAAALGAGDPQRGLRDRRLSYSGDLRLEIQRAAAAPGNPHLAGNLAGSTRASAAGHHKVHRTHLARACKHEGRSCDAERVAVSGLRVVRGGELTSWAERSRPWRPWPRGTSPRSWP